MKKYVVRLKVQKLMKAQMDRDITTDKELAGLLNVNVTQVWRSKLPITDARYNMPGNQLIAGVMKVFGGKFDDYFYIEEVDDPRKTKKMDFSLERKVVAAKEKLFIGMRCLMRCKQKTLPILFPWIDDEFMTCLILHLIIEVFLIIILERQEEQIRKVTQIHHK